MVCFLRSGPSVCSSEDLVHQKIRSTLPGGFQAPSGFIFGCHCAQAEVDLGRLGSLNIGTMCKTLQYSTIHCNVNCNARHYTIYCILSCLLVLIPIPTDFRRCQDIFRAGSPSVGQNNACSIVTRLLQALELFEQVLILQRCLEKSTICLKQS